MPDGNVAVRFLRRPVSFLLEQLDQTLMPQSCPVCNAATAPRVDALCRRCAAALDASGAAPYCGRCGRGMNPFAITERDCGQCRKERHWNIAGLVRAGGYPDELRKLVVDLKYAGRQRNAVLLGRRIADALRRAPWGGEIEALVPVPMHFVRRLQRRCNHARVLADAVGRVAEIPVLNACRRTRHTPSQIAVKSASKRLANVQKCFGIRARRDVSGKTLCIIDNLLATGATVCEVSKVLRKAGAKKIYAAVASRTVLAGGYQADPTADSPA